MGSGRWARLLVGGVLVGVVVAYAGLIVCGVAAAGTLFAILVVATAALDLAAGRSAAGSVLDRVQLNPTGRSLLRDLALALLLTSATWSSSAVRDALVGVALALPLFRIGYLVLLVPLRRRLDPPVVTRNIDLSGLRLPRTPPRLLTYFPTLTLHRLGALPALAGGVAVAVHRPAVFFTVAGLVLAAVAAAAVAVAAALADRIRSLTGDALLAAVHDRVLRLQPEVVLYFSGSTTSVYQANTWLATLDRLSHQVLVVLRERRNLELLDATDSPVICIPGSVEFMNFVLPHVRVAMYPANVGKNIHLLREPGMTHVFIGHGDSDKVASFNPFSKVYTEIWVAGPAGLDRYVKARVGVRPEEVVEVGRPQLDGIAHSASGEPLLTVLYAPTWEGWTNDPAATSLLRAGPAMIERLLAERPRVRVIFKPHPLTGTVSREAKATVARIRALLEADNTARAGDPDLRALPGGAPRRRDPRSDTPDAAPDLSPAERDVRYREWSGQWWPGEASWAHRTVTGPAPTLYDCFNHADVLVADISSVVSDFLASRKPYVVPNLSGLSDEEFRVEYPSAAAAYLLDARAERTGKILDLVRGEDPLAARRVSQRQYLLGPEQPPSFDRFSAAVDDAVAAARAQWPERPTVTAATDIV